MLDLDDVLQFVLIIMAAVNYEFISYKNAVHGKITHHYNSLE